MPRLDAPNTLHHVMVRSLERCAIFRDDADRDEFAARPAALAEAGALTVSAWALLPGHAYFLVRTGTRPLTTVLGVRSQIVYRAAAAWARLLATP